MFTIKFWKAAGERSIKAFAQTLVLTLGAGKVDVMHVAWQTDLGLAAGAAFLSVLTSVGSSAVTGNGPSLTNSETLPGA